MSVFRDRERDEGEKRGDKQKNFCKWGSVSNTTVPAEAINTYLTYTHLLLRLLEGFVYAPILSRTYTHIHTHLHLTLSLCC